MSEKKNGFFNDEQVGDGIIWSLEEIDALLRGEIVHEEPVTEEKHEEPEAELQKEVQPAGDETPAEENEVVSEEDSDGQITFAKMEVTSVPEQEVEEQEPEQLPGENQISIEKTRVFNEVDSSTGFNSEIEHNISDQRVVHTTTAQDENIVSRSNKMESDRIRERFINPPVREIEKTAEHKALLEQLPPKTVERAGFFVEGGQKSATSDLEPMPTLVSADSVKEKEKGEAGEQEVFEDQIVFEGFNSEDEIDTVDEFEAETELIRRRREKAKQFKLYPEGDQDDDTDDSVELPEDDDSDMKIVGDEDKTGEAEEETRENLFSQDDEKKKRRPEPELIEREYFGAKDRKAVSDILSKKRSSALGKMIASIGVFVILAVMSLIVSNADFTVFAGRTDVFLLVNIVLVAFACLVCFDTFKKGAKGLFKRLPNTDSAVFGALSASLIECAVLFAFADAVETRVHVYTAAAAFTLMLNQIGKFIRISQINRNFSYVSADRDFFTVKSIENEDVAFEIGRGLFLGDPDIRYNAMTKFESKFVEKSFKEEPAAYTVMKAFPAALIISVIIGAVTFFITRDAANAVAAFSGTVCLASPAAALLASALNFSSVSRKLAEDNSMMVGYASAEETVKSNAVVFDAAELFDADGCKSYGIKTFNSMRPDEAILYTSAVMIAAGGPLAKLFRSSVIGDRDIFPTVENLNYEDKLGCSAWVEHNKRVLVGNRDLLINHNVEVLDKEYEQKLKRGGRQVIYLAVEHVLSAIYVVGYEPDSEVAALLRKLEKNALPILVRTSDQNITEEFIEESMGLPKNSVKVISSIAGDMFREVYEQVSEKDSSGMLHNGTPSSFLRIYNAAFTLMSRMQIASVLQYIGVGLGVGIMALMSFFSALSQGGALQLIFFQFVWTVVTLIIPRAKQ